MNNPNLVPEMLSRRHNWKSNDKNRILVIKRAFRSHSKILMMANKKKANPPETLSYTSIMGLLNEEYILACSTLTLCVEL